MECDKRNCAAMDDERIRKLEEIGFKFKYSLGGSLADRDDQWEKTFKLLKDYKAKNKGNCNIPTSHHEHKGKPLGKWVGRQKYEQKKFREGKKSHITQYKINRLVELGVKWSR